MNNIEVLFFGNSDSGKSHLIHRFINGVFAQKNKTIAKETSSVIPASILQEIREDFIKEIRRNPRNLSEKEIEDQIQELMAEELSDIEIKQEALEETVEDIPEDATGLYYLVTRKNEVQFSIWDVKGTMLEKMVSYFFGSNTRNVNACVYTLDLSSLLDESKFKQDIESIRKSAPTLPIILIGCKSDLVRQIDDNDFAILQKRYGINHAVITSAKTGEGIDELSTLLVKVSSPQKVKKAITKSSIETLTLDQVKWLLAKNGPLYQAIAYLEILIKELPPYQAQLINDAMIKLVVNLYKNDQTPEEVISNFVKTCSDALNQLSNMDVAKNVIKKVSKGVLIVAGAATVTVFAAAVIFGLSVPLSALLFTSLIAGGTSCLLVKARLFAPLPSAFEQISSAANDNSNFVQPVF